MITYLSNKKRFANFLDLKKKIENLNMFEAIVFNGKNTCFDNIIDKKYLMKKNWKKIGCALSHYLIQKKNIEENINWTLTIEDDFEVEKIQKNFFEKIIQQADSVNCNFVYFDCRSRFRKKQFSINMKENEYFYRMIPQWGAGCYLSHKSAAENLIKCIPLDKPIDMHWFFYNLNKLKNPMVLNPKINPFNNLGVDDYTDLKNGLKSKYSSIIKSKEIKHL